MNIISIFLAAAIFLVAIGYFLNIRLAYDRNKLSGRGFRRRTFLAALIAFVLIMAVMVTDVFAVEGEAEKVESWKPTAELSVGIHNGMVDDYLGAASFNKPFVRESVTVGAEKGETGFYIQGENFSTSEKEPRNTWFYGGGYTKIFGVKVDAGYAFYQTREKGETDYHGIYTEVTFPEIFWQVVPFVKAEYRFAEKFTDADGAKTFMDGFLYIGGLKREFQLHERVNLEAEVSVGGNTGIYGMPAENLSFTREKITLVISLTEQLKLKASALTQQNLGLRDGIAADTDRLFVSAAIVWAF
jgi:hypothetical protein